VGGGVVRQDGLALHLEADARYLAPKRRIEGLSSEFDRLPHIDPLHVGLVNF